MGLMKATTPANSRQPTAARSSPLTGLHHLTAIASDPVANLAFYTGLLGLRRVKTTVNFDDPSAYHLYFGDESGAPGTIVTFFYWAGDLARGRVGSGQVAAISLSVPAASLDFWQVRLAGQKIPVTRDIRHGEERLGFADPDGIPVELIAVADDSRRGWSGGDVPAEHAVRGLHRVELTVPTAASTVALLTGEMGYRVVQSEGNWQRFALGAGRSGEWVDVVADPSVRPGRGGSGTIHHIAWNVPDASRQRELRARLVAAGLHVSDVRDRDYFRSIYYREPNGILFEVATAGPGFAVDEAPEHLGQSLKLPRQFEAHRTQIAAVLPSLAPVAIPSRSEIQSTSSS